MISALEYVRRKDILNNTLFVITPTGRGYFVEDGEYYTREEFKRKYPLPASLVTNNKVNADKTKSFLGAD